MFKPLKSLLLLGFLAPAVLAEPASRFVLEDAWVRALPPGQPNTAAYVTVINRSAQPVKITGGSAQLAGRVEVHTTREVDGYTRMEHLPVLDIGPRTSVSLSPGGIHLMLFGLERMPAPGETVELCLSEASGEQACTTAAVKKSAGASGHDHHQHH